MRNNEAAVQNLEFTRESNDTIKLILKHLGVAITSFFLSFQGALGPISPFGIAFAAAVKPFYIPSALIGSALGYIFSLSGGVIPLRYIATLIAVVVVVRSLSSFEFIKNEYVAIPLITFGCCAATGFTVLFAQEFDWYTLLLYITEAVLAGGTAYFFKICFDGISFKNGLYSIKHYEAAGLLICTSIFLMCFSSLSIFGIAPARIISVYAILVCAVFARESGGSIAGISLGLTLGLFAQSSQLAIGYAFGGLLAGVFSALGPIGVCCAFLIASGVSIILQGLSTQSVIYFGEAIAACIAFTLTPARISDKMHSFFSGARLVPSGTQGVRNSLVMRLSAASDAINDLSFTVGHVSGVMEKKNTYSPNELYARVQEKVCSDCGNCSFCWEHCFNDTMNIFNDTLTVLKGGDDITAESLPQYFRERCIKLTSLLECFNKDYGIHNSNLANDARLSQMRSIAAQQFNSLSSLLKDLSCEFEEEKSFDDEMSMRIMSVLEDEGIPVISVSCILDKFSRMHVEIRCDEIREKVDGGYITGLVSDICVREFDDPCINKIDQEIILTFCEHARFAVKASAAQKNSPNESYCGDSYECFYDGRGRYIMIISDGMGVGGRAAIDSTMTIKLLTQLLKSGFSFDCALEIVNSALMIKSGDESMATLDLVCVDLFSGKTDFYKAGAAATLVRHGKKISKLEKSALPIGILKEVEYSHSTATLSDGDIVLMSSDGAWVTEGQHIIKMLSAFNGDDTQLLCEKISQLSLDQSPNNVNDDITVLTAIINKNI
ncbi:MAG: SpoIIE family protein phosphatase [Oscillospiraceae bacterium]|nr:SpoIIE family protein phosphatase [Oscillospiraceae bacterium]